MLSLTERAVKTDWKHKEYQWRILYESHEERTIRSVIV